MLEKVYTLKFKGNNRYKIENNKKRAYDDYRTYCQISNIKPFSIYKINAALKSDGKIIHKEKNFYFEMVVNQIGVSYNF